MMKRVWCGLLVFACCFFWMLPAAWSNVDILCYHEVDGRRDDQFSIDSKKLESHILYLKENGYEFISADTYLAYTKGELKLPEKSVMLTFDDGYLSFYTKVYPLLEKYQVPALLSIVTSWNEDTKPSDVGTLMDWAQIREMENSGLVTLASHSHALHKQRAVNPQGTLASIARNRLYFNGRYETAEEYETRLERDFKTAQALFTENLGHPLRYFVWPYGDFSGRSMELALQNGFEATFLLAGGENPPTDDSRIYAERALVYGNPDASDLKKLLKAKGDAWNNGPLRMAQVDVDSLYDPDQMVMQERIDNLKNRLWANGVKAVALQAFADPDGDGNVEAVYFYNREVPVYADVFNYIDNALRQSGFRVFAWMPTLVLQSVIEADDSNRITAVPGTEAGWYRRATPFDPRVKEKLSRLFEDLADYTPVDGVLFQDDLYMNDFEDYSIYGMEAYRQATGRDLTELDRTSEAQMAEWTQLKMKAVDDLVGDLAAVFKKNRPEGTVLRNIYTAPVLEPEAKEWFAQDFARYLALYDYTVVMAYPYMDQAKDPAEYLRDIVAAVKAHPGALEKVFFKLQSYDWAQKRWLTEEELAGQIRILEDAGAIHIGYYPDTAMVLPPRMKVANGE